MLNRLFKRDPLTNIYQKKNTVKVVVLLVATSIAALSIIYTNVLVAKLKEREKSHVKLYAEAIERTANQDEDITFLFNEVVTPNNSIPTILTDRFGNYLAYRNIDIKDSYSEEKRQRILERELAEMQALYDPIEIVLSDPRTGMVFDSQFVYYRNSFLLTQLQYYPYFQLLVIGVFAFVTYLVFSYSRTAEQNRVWIGMAKETAHQLGTPLSSLMAWVEYFRADPDTYDPDIVQEIDKDINRLKMITSRFSNIGSAPTLQAEDLYQVIESTMNYLRVRISSKVNVHVQSDSKAIHVRINAPLFEWVIENICKNAVDAMSGIGDLTIHLHHDKEKAVIDITDTGKGIAKAKLSQVFTPGYTTKKRGWGLGLSLSQRIIENYHQGKIFVKQSELDVGTTFRIVLPMQANVANAIPTEKKHVTA